MIAPSLAAELTKVENPADQRILADEVAAGRLTRDEVMRRRAAKHCATPTRATFKFDDSTVQVTIDRPDAPHEAVVARLLAALWKATSGRQGAPSNPRPRTRRKQLTAGSRQARAAPPGGSSRPVSRSCR